MSSAGTILDAIKRQRNNREMQKWLRTKYSDKMKAYSKPSGKKFNPDFQKNLSKEQIAVIRQEVRAEARKENIKAWMYTLLVISVVVFAWHFMFG